MDRQELFQAYAEMTASDRAAFRAEIIQRTGFDAPGVGNAMAATIELMERIKSGEDPIRACHEMLDEMAGMCCD